MTRRDFGVILAWLNHADATSIAAPASVAITMDDFNTSQSWPETAAEVNRRLLRLFEKYSIRITLFVTARNIEDDKNRRLLQAWADAGHIIGNHTYSHFSINSPEHTLTDFEGDVLRAESLLTSIKGYQRIFRFPALKEGNTIELRDGMRAFLREHGYRNGCVTIDASDWYYSERLGARLRQEPDFAIDRFQNVYIDHIRDRSLYYDRLARQILGRSPKHTLLVHYSYLNACLLGAVLEMYNEIGWNLVNSDEAFADPVFRSHPNTLPAGESLIWALAKQTGRYDSQLRYPGEDGAYEKPKLDKLGL